jgi:hypothetical protein
MDNHYFIRTLASSLTFRRQMFGSLDAALQRVLGELHDGPILGYEVVKFIEGQERAVLSDQALWETILRLRQPDGSRSATFNAASSIRYILKVIS